MPWRRDRHVTATALLSACKVYFLIDIQHIGDGLRLIQESAVIWSMTTISLSRTLEERALFIARRRTFLFKA